MTVNKISKPRKTPKAVDLVLRGWTENAVFTLRKTVVVATGQDQLTVDESAILNDYICAIDSILVRAVPARVEESTSQAMLPF